MIEHIPIPTLMNENSIMRLK